MISLAMPPMVGHISGLEPCGDMPCTISGHMVSLYTVLQTSKQKTLKISTLDFAKLGNCKIVIAQVLQNHLCPLLGVTMVQHLHLVFGIERVQIVAIQLVCGTPPCLGPVVRALATAGCFEAGAVPWAKYIEGLGRHAMLSNNKAINMIFNSYNFV